MSDRDEIERLAARADALRAAISRAQMELKSASAEERAITERVEELRAASPAPTANVPPPKTTDEATVLQPNPHHHLSRREQWKVAMAGAGAATLLATIGISMYLAIAPKQVVTIAPPSPPPTAVQVAEPSPAAATTTTGCAEQAAAPTVATALPLPLPSPRPRPRASDRGSSDIADLLGSGLSDDSTPAAPAAKLGALTVVCLPKCDEVIDNGTSLGGGHIFNRPRPAGAHVLQLSAPNGVKKTLRVEIAADQTREVRVSMDSHNSPSTANQRSTNCNPPFVIDDQGRRRYKSECLDRGFDTPPTRD